jgi:phospholipid/cholesterol/gamma-HCH transport system substrate-binding protein
MTRRLSTLRWHLAGRPWLIIFVAAAVPFAIWAAGTRSQPHHVRVSFSAAVNVVPGLDVQIDGFDVGKISSVTLVDGRAEVELGISDERFWPLRRGTTATLRWPTPAGSGTRKVDLDPAGASAPALREGAIIPGRDAVTPVEVDDVFNTFDGGTRRHLRRALKHTATTFGENSSTVRRALGGFDEAAGAFRDVSSDLAADRAALRTLVGATAGVTRRLAPREQAISDLVTVADATLSTFAAHSRQLQASITTFPRTLDESRTTLARLDESVGKVRGLVDDLRPGADQLAALARSAAPALAVLRPAARQGVRVTDRLRANAPPLALTLKTGTPLMDDTRSVLTSVQPMLECVRPYVPEAAGIAVLWGSWTKNYTPKMGPGRKSFATDHYARVLTIASPTSFHAYPKGTSSQIQEALGKKYAMPRPPGLSVGKPWFLPKCGVTEAALDPTKDPEHTP